MKNLIQYIGSYAGRREFIKKLAYGSAGLSFSSFGLMGCASRQNNFFPLKKTSSTDLGESRISLVSGNDRRDMIYEAMKPFQDEIEESIRDKQVVIKLNCVGQNSNPLMVTHPDAVRGILDFLKSICDRQIIIAESTVQNKNPEKTFEIFGYVPLETEYNAKIVELNNEPTTYQWILDKNLYPVRIRVINTFLDPNNYIISVTRLKTHNSVVATLTLKNTVMGAPLKIPMLKINEKIKMHATEHGKNSPKMIHFNIFLMAHTVHPDFAILDGIEGVEGNGPAHGVPVDHRVVLAGPDYLSVDRIGAELMGIPWEYLGYLNYCETAWLGQADRSKIKIIGKNPMDHVIKYRLHDNIDWQLSWMDDLVVKK